LFGAKYVSIVARMIWSAQATVPGRDIDAHPTDHGVQRYELLNLWLVAHDSIAICFRCRDDEILEQVFSTRSDAIAIKDGLPLPFRLAGARGLQDFV
jgi:hypothetical protein